MSLAIASALVADGASPILRELRLQVETVVASASPAALISGEPGAGKRAVARLIHDRAGRQHSGFVEVHCHDHHAASFDVEGGTLFLDEVAVLDAAAQHRLVAALGTPRAQTLAATARDLVAEVNARRFREDLYYRLGAASVVVPPLRAWGRDDIVRMTTALVNELAPRIVSAPRSLSAEALDAIVAHSWPGNIRELRNAIERALFSSRGRTQVGASALALEARVRAVTPTEPMPARTLADVERAHVEQTLREHGFNRTHAARALGISRMTLLKRIRDYGGGEAGT